MERKNIYVCMLAALLSCSDSVKVSRTLDEMPAVFPDYNGVVIPPNIAPLNFALDGQNAGSSAVFSFEGQQFEVKGKKGGFVIPPSKWKKLLESAGLFSFDHPGRSGKNRRLSGLPPDRSGI